MGNFSNNNLLSWISGVYNSELKTLNINNGTNSLITYFDVSNCPNLNCIIVDNPDDANSGVAPYNTWIKDTSASYSTDCGTTTGIDERTGNGISLHPNPASGILYVASDVPLTKIEFYSVTGEKAKVVTSDFSSINLNSLNKGLYIVRLFSKNGVTVKKLMKK